MIHYTYTLAWLRARRQPSHCHKLIHFEATRKLVAPLETGCTSTECAQFTDKRLAITAILAKRRSPVNRTEFTIG